MDYHTTHNKEVYEREYAAEHLRQNSTIPYDRRLVQLRYQLLRQYCKKKAVVDLGCGTGEFLLRIAPYTKKIYGVDFNKKFLSSLRAALTQKLKAKVSLFEEDIQHLSLRNESVHVAYSFATLYHVPHAERVLREIQRVLKKNGIAIIELGAFWSLNTLVSMKNKQGMRTYHLPVRKMLSALRQADLEVLEHRSFQLLPMYGVPVWWMKPLLPLCTTYWRYVMGVRIRGKMLDEWISSLPLLNRLAFRHLFICRKK